MYFDRFQRVLAENDSEIVGTFDIFQGKDYTTFPRAGCFIKFTKLQDTNINN